MNNIKHIDDYLVYLQKSQDLALKELLFFRNRMKIYELTTKGYHDYVCLFTNANPAILRKVEKGLTKDIFEHLNQFDLTTKLDIVDLKMIIDAVEEVKFNKKLKMNRTCRGGFFDEIEQLKKVSDRVSLVSVHQDNTIKLPKFNHLIVKFHHVLPSQKQSLETHLVKS